MAKKLRLGILGMSEGNGHPYSWSAIFNGYDPKEMAKCEFKVIPEYLAKQSWPKDCLDGAEVTHVWTQDKLVSNDIAHAALIPNIVENMEDLIGKVDAILLARDDADNHGVMAIPFLKAGLPVYIDKPLAFCEEDAAAMFNAEQYEGQLFSCSAMRFATELYLTEDEKKLLGKLKFIQAQISKSWDKYAVHILEPIIAGNCDRGLLKKVTVLKNHSITKAQVSWENLEAEVSTFGEYAVPLRITYFGEGNHIQKDFTRTFDAFKASLGDFIKSIHHKELTIPREETIEIVKIIELGR